MRQMYIVLYRICSCSIVKWNLERSDEIAYICCFQDLKIILFQTIWGNIIEEKEALDQNIAKADAASLGRDPVRNDSFW